MNIPTAFPCEIQLTDQDVYVSEGMSLRDYFAAKALTNFYDQIGSQSDQEWFEKIAQGAYRMADAMMEARK